MKLLRIYSCLVFLMLTMAQAASAIDDTPVGWVKIDPPFLSEADMRCTHRSDKTWVPKVTPTGVSITNDPDPNDPDPYSDKKVPDELASLGVERATTYLKYPDGWLVGQDGGEWGGKLLWVSASGEIQTLIKTNTRILIRDGNSVIAAGGLTHLILDEGYAAKLSRDAVGTWRVITEQQTGTSIKKVIKVDEENFILMGSTGILRLHFEFGIVSRYKNEKWHFSYPHKAVRDTNGDILVGMRHAVAVLKEKGSTWSERWLVQKSCPYRRKVKGSSRCECVLEPPKTSSIDQLFNRQ